MNSFSKRIPFLLMTMKEVSSDSCAISGVYRSDFVSPQLKGSCAAGEYAAQ